MLFAKIFGLEDAMYPDAKMYSCNDTTPDHSPHLAVGILYLTIGILCQLCYIPCIIVIIRSELLRMSCFKIMVYLGVVDICCLTICADLAGFWSITGTHFCENEALSYVAGNIAMGFWGASCFCCIFLAINRTADLIYPGFNNIFDGNRMNYWLILPTMYFTFFTFFERPLLYSPTYNTFFFDPITEYSRGLPIDVAQKLYSNVPHTVNNVVVIFALLTLYLVMLCSLFYKMKYSRNGMLSGMTKQILLQLFIICGCHFLGCFLYVYTQFFSVPPVFTIITNLAWIGNHGLPALVYLFLNRTIRKKVLALLRISSPNQSNFIVVGRNIATHSLSK